MPETRSRVRTSNTQKRNERLRQAFQKRYTDQPRPRKHSKELVVAQLAEEFCLSTATVEGIIWTRAENNR